MPLQSGLVPRLLTNGNRAIESGPALVVSSPTRPIFLPPSIPASLLVVIGNNLIHRSVRAWIDLIDRGAPIVDAWTSIRRGRGSLVLQFGG